MDHPLVDSLSSANIYPWREPGRRLVEGSGLPGYWIVWVLANDSLAGSGLAQVAVDGVVAQLDHVAAVADNGDAWTVDAGHGALQSGHGPGGVRIGAELTRCLRVQGGQCQDVEAGGVERAYVLDAKALVGTVSPVGARIDHAPADGGLSLAVALGLAGDGLHGRRHRPCPRLRMVVGEAVITVDAGDPGDQFVPGRDGIAQPDVHAQRPAEVNGTRVANDRVQVLELIDGDAPAARTRTCRELLQHLMRVLLEVVGADDLRAELTVGCAHQAGQLFVDADQRARLSVVLSGSRLVVEGVGELSEPVERWDHG